MPPSETKGTYSLLGSEDTYSGQNSQSPTTSRQVQSWLSNDNGQLYREAAEVSYLPTQLPGPVVSLYEFDYNDNNGNIVRNYFAAARTSFVPGTLTCQLYQQSGGAWVLVSFVGTLVDAPMFITLQNMMQVADGVSNYLYDGTGWANVGIEMPYQGGYTSANKYTGPPFWTPAIDTSQTGTFSPVVGRYYWFTNADQTPTRPITESSSSWYSPITGPLTNKKVAVYQTAGFWSVGTGSLNITVSASSDNPGPTLPLNQVSPSAGLGPAILSEAFAGKTLYIDGTLIGVVAGVGISGGLNYLQLTAPSPAGFTNGRAVLVDARCTHWNIYASESDNSLVGQFLNLSIPVTQNLGTTPVYDQSPYISDPTNTFVPIFRPVRNDPPPGSKILEVHKYRAFRTRLTRPNFFSFSANEEVASGNNGDPVECVPGATSTYEATAGAVQNGSVQNIAGSGASIAVGQEIAGVTITSKGDYSAGDLPVSVSFSGGGGTGAAGTVVTQQLIVKGVPQGTWFVTGVTMTNNGTGYTSAPTVTFSASSSAIARGTAVLGSQPFWSNSNDVTLSDGTSFATTSLPSSKVNSKFLEAKAFGFAISGSNTITGIQVDLTALSSIPAGNNLTLQLLKAGAVVGSTKVSLVTGQMNYTFGSSAFLWGTSWNPSDVNNTNFGVAIYATQNGSASIVSVQNVKTTIYYQQPLPGGLQLLTNTISDLVNETSFPDQSNKIRGLKSYASALYMASEKQVFPLYGESIDDFAFSQVAAFSVGLAGRFGWQATPHGLVFLSYDRKGFLYPTTASSPYWSGPLVSNATENLVEFGKPMRNKFAQIDPTRLDEVVTSFYFFGQRNWFVIGYPTTTGAWITYVYDFNTKGWFQLQRGFSSLAVYEVSSGIQVLVGGAPDGYTYVIDDLSGTYVSTANLPQASWTPALINFGEQGSMHVAKYVELEFTSALMAADMTVTFWIDPLDVDNPGTGRTTPLKKVELGANRYRAWFTEDNAGTTCERLLINVTAQPSTNAGAIRGAKLAADPAPGLLR